MANIEQLGFGWDLVCSLAGLTKDQLRYWDHTGFFSPQYRDGPCRIYSFRDLVGLRAIAKLRDHVPLQELRKVGAWLGKSHEEPWSTLRLYVVNRVVLFRDPHTDQIVSTRPEGQITSLQFKDVANEVHDLIMERQKRNRDQVGKIIRTRSVARNKPVVAGTRIPAEAIWNFRQAGYTYKQILDEYPTLIRKDIKAAIEYVERQKAS